jgi:DNA-binding SARP family transcriptional activator
MLDPPLIRTLGPLEVVSENGLVQLRSLKARALLVYLARAPGRAHPRAGLAGLLWPDAGEQAARASLRQALAKLRKALGNGTLAAERSEVTFLGDSPWRLDINELERLATTQELSALRQASALIRGRFLEELEVPDSPRFEEWLRTERRLAEMICMSTLYRVGDDAARCKEWQQAELSARRMIAMEPWDERGHRLLMRTLAGVGRRGAALRQYELCQQTLGQELGVPATVETQELAEAIRRQESPPMAAAAPSRTVAREAKVTPHPKESHHHSDHRPEAAARRMIEAAENAAVAGALRDADRQLRDAVEALEEITSSAITRSLELRVRLLEGAVASALCGPGGPEQARAMARATELTSHGAGPLADLYLQKTFFDLGRGRPRPAVAVAEKALWYTVAARDTAREAAAHGLLGFAMFQLGTIREAVSELLLARELTPGKDRLDCLAFPGHDVAGLIFGWLGLALAVSGQLDGGMRSVAEGLRWADSYGLVGNRAQLLEAASMLHLMHGKISAARDAAEENAAYSSRHDLPIHVMWSNIWRHALDDQLPPGQRAEQLSLGIARWQDAGVGTDLVRMKRAEVELWLAAGDPGRAWKALERTQQTAEELGEGLFVPELHRLRGELAAIRGEPPAEHLVRALDLADQQGAALWKLKAQAARERLLNGHDGTPPDDEQLRSVPEGALRPFELIEA